MQYISLTFVLASCTGTSSAFGFSRMQVECRLRTSLCLWMFVVVLTLLKLACRCTWACFRCWWCSLGVRSSLRLNCSPRQCIMRVHPHRCEIYARPMRKHLIVSFWGRQRLWAGRWVSLSSRLGPSRIWLKWLESAYLECYLNSQFDWSPRQRRGHSCLVAYWADRALSTLH